MGRKRIFQYIACSPSSRKVRPGSQDRNIQAEPDAKAMEECCLLPCTRWLAHYTRKYLQTHLGASLMVAFSKPRHVQFYVKLTKEETKKKKEKKSSSQHRVLVFKKTGKLSAVFKRHCQQYSMAPLPTNNLKYMSVQEIPKKISSTLCGSQIQLPATLGDLA